MTSHTKRVPRPLNLKTPGLFGGVLFGEMKFVLSNFLSSENLSMANCETFLATRLEFVCTVAAIYFNRNLPSKSHRCMNFCKLIQVKFMLGETVQVFLFCFSDR